MYLENSEIGKKCILLSELPEDGSLIATARALYPGQHCSFRAVAGIVPLIKNSYALLLGPAICLYNAKLSMNMRSLTSDPRPNNLLFVNYSQEDIIFGFREKVRAAILQADREYHPEVLFLVTSCLQEIVGEDFDSCIDEIRPHVQAKLLIVHTENFTCEGATPGVENMFKSLFELMTPQPKREKSVNILGLWTSTARKTELAGLLNDKGIEIKNVIPSYCTPSELQMAPGVQLNIVLDQYALPLAKMMKEEFGTQYIYCRKPYLPDSIEKWYKEIAGALNIDLSCEVEELKRKTEELLSEARTSLVGKTCTISGISGRPFDLALLLSCLGIEPKVILLQTILPEDRPDIQKLLAGGIDPIIFRGDNSLQNEELLAELSPDISLGALDHQALARMAIMPVVLSTSYYMLGFESTNEVLRLLLEKPAGLEALMYKEKILAEGGC
ncbi:MAG: nitrogenase component 1 [Methanothrix sp.]